MLQIGWSSSNSNIGSQSGFNRLKYSRHDVAARPASCVLSIIVKAFIEYNTNLYILIVNHYYGILKLLFIIQN